MKILADMGISSRVVSALREQGPNAVHLQEQGLGRMPDGEIQAKARERRETPKCHYLSLDRCARRQC